MLTINAANAQNPPDRVRGCPKSYRAACYSVSWLAERSWTAYHVPRMIAMLLLYYREGTSTAYYGLLKPRFSFNKNMAQAWLAHSKKVADWGSLKS